MKAKIVLLNVRLGNARATTDNDIAVSFRPPADGSLSLSQELDIDLEILDVEQTARNLTTGKAIQLKIAPQDVHDLRLPEGRWPTRFPSLERRRGD